MVSSLQSKKGKCTLRKTKQILKNDTKQLRLLKQMDPVDNIYLGYVPTRRLKLEHAGDFTALLKGADIDPEVHLDLQCKNLSSQLAKNPTLKMYLKIQRSCWFQLEK